MITLNGFNLSNECPYCGSDLDNQTVEDLESEIPEIQKREPTPNINDLHRMNIIHCWYCDASNNLTNRHCISCNADLFAVTKQIKDDDRNKRFVSQMNSAKQNEMLIMGIKALIRAILKREGNKDGVMKCQNSSCHGGSYNYDEFSCPSCNSPSLLQEMRGFITGVIKNSDIARELQKAFPQFSILKYTNSAVMDHRTISASKMDLEDAARQTASMLRTGAEFLRAVTGTKKTKTQQIDLPQVQQSQPGAFGGLFDMRGVDLRPDTSIMEMFNAIPLNAEQSTQQQINTPLQEELPVAETSVNNDEDWEEP